MFDAKSVSRQVVEWIAGYFHDNGSSDTKAIVGISGGKDSTVVAALCLEALGKERVLGVVMPNGVQADIEVSYEVCKLLDIPYLTINIAGAVQAICGAVGRAGIDGAFTKNNNAMLNIPARVRMTVLYAISGIIGGRVANTCNLSEDWVGYSTKFGDAAGDFSPLSDLTVTEVKAIGRELKLPAELVDKTPEDGLSGKSDEANLGFSYDELDLYIRSGICEDEAVRVKIDNLHRLNMHKVSPMPAFRRICD